MVPLNWPTSEGRLRCSCGKSQCPAPAKHPHGKLAPRGLLSATTEPGILKHWFAVTAPQANLGVVTNKLVVLDVDPRHDGDASLRNLERNHQPLPLTWRSLTGGGGEHVIFSCPAGVNVSSSQAHDGGALGPGIDVRARGGYVIAPPSRHASGRNYYWSVDHHPADVPLAEPPPWLLALLANRTSTIREPVPREQWMRIATGPVTEYADFAAARLAGHLFRHGIDAALVLGLLQAWNSTRCTPPLDPAELHRVVNRIAAREAQRLEQALLHTVEPAQ